MRFTSSFITADAYYQAECTVHVSAVEYEELKVDYLRKWFRANLPKDDVLGKPSVQPSAEQLSAIGAVSENIQVVARAGSGKTATIVNRAFFLHKHCDIPLDQMLLMAFNRKAAREMADRLEKLMGMRPPHVMTFHALAYAIASPEGALLYDDQDGEDQAQSRFIQQVLDEHLSEDGFVGRVRDAMLAHVRANAEREWAVKEGMKQDKYLEFRRSQMPKTLRGETLKSGGEAIIANCLFEFGIPYQYERKFLWDGRAYRPDFAIPRGNGGYVVIEYYGMEGDPDYDNMTGDKRGYWEKQKNSSLIELSRTELVSLGPEGFRQLLTTKLEGLGIECVRISEEELWELVEEHIVSDFAGIVRSFIGRCRKIGWGPEDLNREILLYTVLDPSEAMVLAMCRELYAAYLERLVSEKAEDFDGLMQGAADSVKSGKTAFFRKSGNGDLRNIRYIFIDEYQDFSYLFDNFISSFIFQNPNVQLFCVGDDWQAINGFAGSDLSYFEEFVKERAPAHRLNLATNYRSTQQIVELGNALMVGRGQPARSIRAESGTICLCDLTKFTPTIEEKEEFLDDLITPAVLRIVGQAIRTNQQVLLLSRRNGMPWNVSKKKSKSDSATGLEIFVQRVRSFLPEGDRTYVDIMTAHRSKGTEKATVIVLDAVARSYPLIHPSWVFFQVFGDTLEALIDAERRLFYVALTRAKDDLVIISDDSDPSPFLKALATSNRIERMDLALYPTTILAIANTVSLRVRNASTRRGGGTYAIRDLLKKEGFKWDNANQTWHRRYETSQYTRDILAKAEWVGKADGVEIDVLDEKHKLIEQYTVVAGNLHQSSLTVSA